MDPQRRTGAAGLVTMANFIVPSKLFAQIGLRVTEAGELLFHILSGSYFQARQVPGDSWPVGPTCELVPAYRFITLPQSPPKNAHRAPTRQNCGGSLYCVLRRLHGGCLARRRAWLAQPSDERRGHSKTFCGDCRQGIDRGPPRRGGPLLQSGSLR